MDDMAFISFRLPRAERDRLRAAAVRSGDTLQEFMQRLVRDRLNAVRNTPSLSQVLKRLREHRDWLRERGVSRMWVFGSVARGEEQSDSDVDLIAEIDPQARVSLTAFARLRLDLSDLLGAPVDLVEWRTLRSQALASAEREAVAVF
jgi:predicted nucleotidyltransferase